MHARSLDVLSVRSGEERADGRVHPQGRVSSIRRLPAASDSTTCRLSNVFYNFIDRMAVLNITLGCTPDHLMYCPNDSVTRAQMAAFLVRAFGLCRSETFCPPRPGVLCGFSY